MTAGPSPLLWAAGVMPPADWAAANVHTALVLSPKPLSHSFPATWGLSPNKRLSPLVQLLGRELVQGSQDRRREQGLSELQTKGMCSRPVYFLGFRYRKLGTCQGDTDTTHQGRCRTAFARTLLSTQEQPRRWNRRPGVLDSR